MAIQPADGKIVVTGFSYECPEYCIMLRSQKHWCLTAFFCLQFIWTFAGGWPQPQGGYFIKLSEWWIDSDQHFDSDGIIRPNIVNYGYYATSLYAEYGISHRWTALLNFPFLNYAYTQLPSSLLKTSIWKPGDAEAGIKYALTYLRPIALSVGLSVTLPFGYEENEALQTGYGSITEMVRMDLAKSFKAFHSDAWINVHSGYRLRNKGFADEFQYGIEGGVTLPNKKLSVIARLEGITALGDDENAVRINPQSLFSNFREYVGISPEIIYHVDDNWGITLGAGFALSGQNIFANPSFVGLFNRFQNKMDRNVSPAADPVVE